MQNKLDYTIHQWIKGLKEKYHLSLINKDTFKEIYSLQVSKGRFFLVVSSFVIVIFSITFLLIAFTPLKRWVPGFESVTMHNQFVDLQKRLIVMEEEVNGKLKYAQQLDTIFNDFDASFSQIDSLSEGIANGNKSRVEAPLSEELYQLHFYKPTEGIVSQKYKPQENHFGIDIVCEKNEAVKATLAGKVLLAIWTIETGNTLLIQHQNNLLSVYKHNRVLLKKMGDKVHPGEVIAIVGNSGEQSTGPHLHFEIWYKGKAIDPKEVISFQ